MFIRLMFYTHSVTKESEKMAKNCYMVDNAFENSFLMRLEISSLAAELQNSIARFSANDLFDVNLNTLCGVLTTTVTYFVVIIQFRPESP